ncbi:DUF4174 domain-containing protein [Hymenobacter caeli]|uniref:DUF4174 domain-containing protein n=1 Tax=Hymenobacter caeli TaxID=2735894 RepID=A0ABX2FWY3_9BACT|nr:DUF4174 domain-containing protein [Hymenobacter caeli]NRT21288.1 hypothetical protein [Hymenobacter caeli]
MQLTCLVLATLLAPLGRVAAQTPAPPPALQPALQPALHAARGQRRVLLVGAATAAGPDFKRQQALLAAVPDQLRARDLQVLAVLYDELSPADRQLAQRLGLRPPAFGVVLIGKDGGAKRSSARPLAPADLFSTIDQMPMRQQEMRRRGQQ